MPYKPLSELNNNTPDDRLLVPINDTRRLLGNISRTTVYELVARGEIVKVNIGARGFITAKSLADYVDRLTAAAHV
jgi:hypothetical protein